MLNVKIFYVERKFDFALKQIPVLFSIPENTYKFNDWKDFFHLDLDR